jgi:glycosyltransferase involved in cell wall biosynthesis
MATLDILIPHYNDVTGLDLALKSIAGQSWTGERRIVIVDDGSEPESLAAVRALAEAFPYPTTVIANQRNRGRPYTRNVLIDAIDSPYVAWLDAGDEWYPQKIETQLRALEKAEESRPGEAIWMTCHYHWQWQHNAQPRKKIQKTNQDQIKALLTGTDLRAYLWTLLARAETFRSVGWFDERLPRLQDLDYFLRFALKQGWIARPGTNEALCVYHKSDLGRSADQVRQCNSYIFDKYRVLYNRYGLKFSLTRLYHMEMHSARFAANNDDHDKARDYMRKAMRMRPRLFAKHFLRKGFRP